MRKLLLLIMIALLVAPTVFAGRKRDKAGVVADYVYTDKKHKFSLTLNEEWKYKIQDNDSDLRLSLNQINYGVPPEYVQTPDYTKIPRIVVYVVESKLAPRAFIDSLISPSYSSDAKKEVLKECDILNMNPSTGFTPEKIITRKNKALKLDNRNGFYWTGQVKYTNEVSISASSTGGKRVKGGYGGCLAVIQDDEKLVLFHMISEWNYFDAVFDESMKIINSIKFN